MSKEDSLSRKIAKMPNVLQKDIKKLFVVPETTGILVGKEIKLWKIPFIPLLIFAGWVEISFNFLRNMADYTMNAVTDTLKSFTEEIGMGVIILIPLTWLWVMIRAVMQSVLLPINLLWWITKVFEKVKI